MSHDPPVNRPSVARPRKRWSGLALILPVLLGALVLFKLADSRAARAEQATGLPALSIAATSAPSAPLTPAAITTAAPFVPTIVATQPSMPTPSLGVPPAPGGVPPGAVAIPDRRNARLGAPTLIVDLVPSRAASGGVPASGDAGQAGAPVPAAPDLTGAATGAAGEAGSTGSAGRDLSGNERFAARIGGQDVEVSQAQRLTDLDRLVPQGAIIGAVLETALDSDLPGFARAIVSRDVLSFDGSAVLVPAGSRVIGQYNSGVAQGASRIFIVWSRLIRPDGVSIALGSPAVDDLGRGGLAGKVNRHFLQRFGGAILLSVLTGGINAASAAVSRGSTVVVTSASEATSLASQASRGTDIPPTIKTKQGANVRIFVARDLDFSAVGPAR